jgi:ribosome-binding protein aMBF1 (putative translation factor)
VSSRVVRTLDSDEYDELIAVLKEAREAAGLRHDELSRKLGHSRMYIYKVESKRRRLDPAEVRQIASALGLEPLEVFKRWLNRLSDSDQP